MNLSSCFVAAYSIRRVNITSRNETAYILFLSLTLSSVSDGGMRRIKREEREREREKNEHSYKVVPACRRRRSTFIIDTFLSYRRIHVNCVCLNLILLLGCMRVDFLLESLTKVSHSCRSTQQFSPRMDLVCMYQGRKWENVFAREGE